MLYAITRTAVVLALLVASAPDAGAQPRIAMTGKASTLDGKPLERVKVTVYKQGAATEGTTSAMGEYRIDVLAGGFIDSIVFERQDLLPRVVEGPFSATDGSAINVVLPAAMVRGLSLSGALAAIHSVQFLKLVLNRADVQIPKTLAIPNKLALAARAVADGTAQDPSTGERPSPDQPKRVDFWPMDDPFFSALGAKP